MDSAQASVALAAEIDLSVEQDATAVGHNLGDDRGASPPEVALGAEDMTIAARVELAAGMDYSKAQRRALVLKQTELQAAEKHLDV